MQRTQCMHNRGIAKTQISKVFLHVSFGFIVKYKFTLMNFNVSLEFFEN